MVLRFLSASDAIRDTPQHNLPIMFRGSLWECSEFARRMGYVWKEKRSYLFRGYYVKPGGTGECLMPDVG